MLLLILILHHWRHYDYIINMCISSFVVVVFSEQFTLHFISTRNKEILELLRRVWLNFSLYCRIHFFTFSNTMVSTFLTTPVSLSLSLPYFYPPTTY